MEIAGRIIRLWQKAPFGWRHALVGSRFGSVARKVANRYFPDGPQVFELNSPLSGYRMRLHWQTQKAFVFGTYEPPVVAEVEKHVAAGMTALDIGAHLGYFTLLLASRVGAEGRVWSFEPWPATYQALCENLRLNALSNVYAENAAVLNRAGPVRIGCANDDPLSSIPSLTADDGIEVPGVALDDWAAGKLDGRRIQFIKMDAEGSETAILQGMQRILREHRPVMIIELHGYDRTGENHAALAELHRAGYRHRHIAEPGAQAVIVAEPLN